MRLQSAKWPNGKRNCRTYLKNYSYIYADRSVDRRSVVRNSEVQDRIGIIRPIVCYRFTDKDNNTAQQKIYRLDICEHPNTFGAVRNQLVFSFIHPETSPKEFTQSGIYSRNRSARRILPKWFNTRWRRSRGWSAVYVRFIWTKTPRADSACT